MQEYEHYKGFCVGDIVQIKEWDEMIHDGGFENLDRDVIEFENIVFLDSMRYLCGASGEITHIIDNDTYVKFLLDDNYIQSQTGDYVGVENWIITAEMIKPYNHQHQQFSPDAFNELLGMPH